MDDEDDRYRGRARGGREPGETGARFRDGRALQTGRTESAGWRKEVVIELGDGSTRIADGAKFDVDTGDVVETVETKVANGELQYTREMREQLAKDVRLAQERGIRCTWEIAAEKIPKAAADAFARAARETGGMVQAVELTRAERNTAFQAARTLERSRAHEMTKTLAQQIERLRVQRDRQDPVVQKHRARDEAAAHQIQRDQARSAAESIAKQFAENFLKPAVPKPDPGEAHRQELERMQRERDTREVTRQRREAARAAARLPRDVANVLALGQAHDIWSSTADPTETTASQTRAGREARGRGQERGGIARGQ